MDNCSLFTNVQADAKVIIAASEQNMDMYYLTKFFAPDPFAVVVTPQETVMIVSDLEYERAKVEAQVDTVLRMTELLNADDPDKSTVSGTVRAAYAVLQQHGFTKIQVPASFPVIYADYLRTKSIEVTYPCGRFIDQRSIKTEEEIGYIETAVSDTEIVLYETIELIKKAKIVGDVLELNNAVLTSEKLKNFMTTRLFDRGYLALNTIIAGGEQSYDPHNQGNGPLPANKPIIIDVFPRSLSNHYFADMTRTVLRGMPDKRLEAMFDAVLQAHTNAVASIKAGVSVGVPHQACCDVFTQKGFVTGMLNGSIQGFIHSTGHGVGLDIHEEPRLYTGDELLRPGHVVTVEPGLYYREFGGVRLEDLVVVQPDGCRNLNHLEKVLLI